MFRSFGSWFWFFLMLFSKFYFEIRDVGCNSVNCLPNQQAEILYCRRNFRVFARSIMNQKQLMGCSAALAALHFACIPEGRVQQIWFLFLVKVSSNIAARGKRKKSVDRPPGLSCIHLFTFMFKIAFTIDLWQGTLNKWLH